MLFYFNISSDNIPKNANKRLLVYDKKNKKLLFDKKDYKFIILKDFIESEKLYCVSRKNIFKDNKFIKEEIDYLYLITDNINLYNNTDTVWLCVKIASKLIDPSLKILFDYLNLI